jgi:hypothetical protein
MKNLIFVLGFLTVFAFAANAQSKDCCSKEKGETTKVEKCTDKDHTMKNGDIQKTTTTTSAGLKDGKQVVEKEVVMTKGDKKEKCSETSSCCTDMKKEKKNEKVEKEVEKKETH